MTGPTLNNVTLWTQRAGMGVLILLTLFGCALELRHRSKYGHFAAYGIHTDVVSENHDLGIPGVQTVYCMVLTNLTFFPAKFEAIKLPGGFIGSGYKYHDQLQKWDQKSGSWVTVMDTVAVSAGSGWDRPNITRTIWPGQSIYPIGWDAIAATEGVTSGDTVRIAVFNTFRPVAALPETPAYSPVFIVRP